MGGATEIFFIDLVFVLVCKVGFFSKAEFFFWRFGAGYLVPGICCVDLVLGIWCWVFGAGYLLLGFVAEICCREL